jgi:hypothetical protein
MPAIHSAIDGLIGEGAVRLMGKGRILGERAGPYHIGLPSDVLAG